MIGTIVISQAEEVARLSGQGIALMVACIGFVLALCAFCFTRILREKQPSARHHAPLDIDTRDVE